MSDAPLDLEPVLGWRAWRLERRPEGLRLISLTRDDAWPAQEALEARCHRTSHGKVPVSACTCGIYATREPEDLARAGIMTYGVAVVGAIAMWGRVIEHEAGARAQKAYPARLRLVCGACLASGRGAVDPVRVLPGASGLAAACAAHADGAPGAIDARKVQSELLATYAVDLLPLERVDEALKTPRAAGKSAVRFALETVGIGVLMILRLAINVVMLLMLVGWVLGIAGTVFGVITDVLGIDEPATAVSSPAVSASDASFILVDYPEEVPPVRVVCGTGRGDSIGFVSCASGLDDVFGVATQEPPAGAGTDCLADWVAYSSGHDHWICWHPVEGESPDVERFATAPDPFDAPTEG